MQDLFRKYIDNQCSPDKVKKLLAYFNSPGNETELRKLITEGLENTEVDDDGNRWNSHTDKMYAAIKDRMNTGNNKVVPIFRKTWFRVAVAVVFVAGAFAIYNLTNRTNQEQSVVKADNVSHEIGADNDKAILTLADGSMINLETVANGTLTLQGETKIIKSTKGQLAYKLLSEKPTEGLFNSITTPRGGQYQVTLSDGSKVWLNAASSLRFPAAFTGAERKVELTGEGYFEVAKNAAMPFKVEVAGKNEVEVLGTHFNVNAYSDEATVNTTLLEGRVKVTGFATHDSHIITPGEQAQLNDNGEIAINEKADTELVMGWKNGTFNFTNADLGRVFRELSRWYNVDIVFEGAIPKRKFNGEIQRDLKLSQVLNLLRKNNVSCRLEGRRLIVQQ